MPKFSVKVKGLDAALRSAKEIPKKLVTDLDNETERSALRVVNDARSNAPYRDGLLRNSIRVYDKKLLQRTIGSDRPYAQRQEYEHATRKGYFRKALYAERETFRSAIEKAIKKAGD